MSEQQTGRGGGGGERERHRETEAETDRQTERERDGAGWGGVGGGGIRLKSVKRRLSQGCLQLTEGTGYGTKDLSAKQQTKIHSPRRDLCLDNPAMCSLS